MTLPRRRAWRPWIRFFVPPTGPSLDVGCPLGSSLHVPLRTAPQGRGSASGATLPAVGKDTPALKGNLGTQPSICLSAGLEQEELGQGTREGRPCGRSLVGKGESGAEPVGEGGGAEGLLKTVLQDVWLPI